MTVLNLQIGAGADDGYTEGTTWSSTADLWIGKWGSTSEEGTFRWNSVTVPQGDTIDSAQIQLHSNTTTTGLVLKIIGDDVDDCAALSSSHHGGSGWTNTTAQTDWDFNSTADNWEVSPDIKTVVQEIVDRGSWASGNDLGLYVAEDGISGNRDFLVSQYEQDTSLAAKLDITYSAAPSGAGVAVGQNHPSRNHLLRL